MTPSLSNLVEELRALHEKATPGEWTYRSNQHDDWGVVRGPSGYYVAQAHPGRRLTDEEENEHRQNKTDPHGPNALFIIAAHTHLPTLLSALEGEKETESALARIRTEALEEAATIAEGAGCHGYLPSIKADIAKRIRALKSPSPPVKP